METCERIRTLREYRMGLGRAYRAAVWLYGPGSQPAKELAGQAVVANAAYRSAFRAQSISVVKKVAEEINHGSAA